MDTIKEIADYAKCSGLLTEIYPDGRVCFFNNSKLEKRIVCNAINDLIDLLESERIAYYIHKF